MTFLDDLAAVNPVRDESPYGGTRASALVDDITAGRLAAPPPPPAPTRRPSLVGGIAVAAAATLAGVLIIPPVLRHDAQVSPGLPVPTSASATPNRATPTASTQYWKTVTKGIGIGGAGSTSGEQAAYSIPFMSTDYIPVDSTRSSYQVYDAQAGTLLTGSARFPLPEPRHQVVARPGQSRASGSPGSWQTPGPGWVATMPRDVPALRQQLYAEPKMATAIPDATAFDDALMALSSKELPPDLRAAIVRVIATIPGARVESSPVVAGGFSGSGLSLQANAYVGAATICPQQRDVILDIESGIVYLDRSTVSAACAGIAKGSRVKERFVIQRVLVDAVPAEILAATSQPCDRTHWTRGAPNGCDVGQPIPSTTTSTGSTPGHRPSPGPTASGAWTPDPRQSG